MNVCFHCICSNCQPIILKFGGIVDLIDKTASQWNCAWSQICPQFNFYLAHCVWFSGMLWQFIRLYLISIINAQTHAQMLTHAHKQLFSLHRSTNTQTTHMPESIWRSAALTNFHIQNASKAKYTGHYQLNIIIFFTFLFRMPSSMK